MSKTYRFRKYTGERSFLNHFASPDEIKHILHRVDLTQPIEMNHGGAAFISDTKEAYVDDGDYHTLILGATGSMKTRLFVMPTVFTLALAGENMVITDPKGEIYDVASSYLKEQGYEVKVLNLRDMTRSDSWNPLEEAFLLYQNGKKEEALKQANDFVSVLMADLMAKNNDLFWPMAAKQFIEGCVETLIRGSKKVEECNMSSVLSFISYTRGDNGSNSDSVLRDFVAKLPPNNSIRQHLETTVCNAPNTMGGILGLVSSGLQPFVSSKALQNLSASSTIDLHAFKDPNRKVAVFVLVPDESTTFHFFIASFIKQLYSAAVADAFSCPNGALPRRLNFLLDEFANIPRIADMPSMITAGRSRNIRFYLVVQSDNQLRSNYGNEAETIKTNCLNWVYLASKENGLIQQVQTMVGSSNRMPSSEPLISFFELTNLKKIHGEEGGAEALILISRSKPYMTFLPDISRYTQFIGRDPLKLPKTSSKIIYFDFKKNMINLSASQILDTYQDAIIYKTEEEDGLSDEDYRRNNPFGVF